MIESDCVALCDTTQVKFLFSYFDVGWKINAQLIFSSESEN